MTPAIIRYILNRNVTVRKMYTLTCKNPECQTGTFTAKRSDAQFCSTACRVSVHRRQKGIKKRKRREYTTVRTDWAESKLAYLLAKGDDHGYQVAKWVIEDFHIPIDENIIQQEAERRRQYLQGS